MIQICFVFTICLRDALETGEDDLLFGQQGEQDDSYADSRKVDYVSKLAGMTG
jgi:hypothetical protein